MMFTEKRDIQSEQRNGNLFIKISGDFDRESGSAITEAIRAHYNGHGNIFINTEHMRDTVSAGRDILADILADCHLPEQKIFLIGRKGFEIGPDGCRVIMRRRKKCCGKCKNCGC